MGIIEPMVMEFEHEAANTRKVLERVPLEKADFKPAEKSMTLQSLTSHLADVAKWAKPTCQLDVFELDPETWQPFKAETTEGLLKAFDQNVAEAIEALKE